MSTEHSTPDTTDRKSFISPEHRAELAKRAISLEYAERAGLFSIDLAEHSDFRRKYRLDERWPRLPGYRTTGLGMPYPPALDKIQRIRVRCDKTTIYSADGTTSTEIPRYATQANVPPIPYYTEEALAAAEDVSVPIYFVEGGLKPLCLGAHGLAAIGLGGVNAGAHDKKIKDEFGEIVASPELTRIRWRGRRVYIIFDAFIDRNPMVALGAAVLWKVLEKLGADVWIVNIPFREPLEADLTKGEFYEDSDQGPDDYVALKGWDEFLQRIAEAQPMDPEARVRHLVSRPDDLRAAVRSLSFAACLHIASKEGEATKIADVANALPKGFYGKRDLAKIVESFAERLAKRAAKNNPDPNLWERGDEAEGADRLLKTFGAKTHMVSDGGDLYRYEDGIYAEIENPALVTQAAGWAGQIVAEKGQPLKIRYAWIVGAIKIALARATKLGQPGGFFGNSPNAVGFRNGVLVVEHGRLVRNEDGTPKLHDHDAKWRLRAKYDFDYVPGLSPEKILATLRDHTREGDRDIQCWREFSGASIFGLAPKFERALMLRGKGGAGKSTWLRITRMAFPETVMSAVAPQSLDVPCNRAKLVGKRINIVADLPERQLLDTGTLKAVISGDQIEARNLYEDPFDFAPIAGHIFACNKLPPHNDNTRGFARRWIVFDFPAPVANPNVHHLETLKDEIPALVSFFVDGLCALLDRGGYDLPATSERIVKEWVRDGSQIDQFIDDCLETLGEGDRNTTNRKTIQTLWTKASKVYDKYKEWAASNGHKQMSNKTFGQELRATLNMADEGQIASGNYYPVRLRPMEIPADPDGDWAAQVLEGTYGTNVVPIRRQEPTLSVEGEVHSPSDEAIARVRAEWIFGKKPA